MKGIKRELLIKLRMERKLHQKDVAEFVGITTSYYGMIEQGVRNPSLELAEKISAFFGKRIDEIFFTDKQNITLEAMDSA